MLLTMMLIFRNGFTEVIKISSSLQAGERPDISIGTFKSFANALCAGSLTQKSKIALNL